jgi:phenylalanyl-tRNA synthetase alpha chain
MSAEAPPVAATAGGPSGEAALAAAQTEAEATLRAVVDAAGLERWYRAQLSASGAVSALRKGIGQLPLEARKPYGAAINALSTALTSAFEARKAQIEAEALDARLQAERVDLTLPPRRPRVGRLHPLRSTLREINAAFQSMGFAVYDSPHVETDEYNFQLLNIPPHHPARDMQDTFYVASDGLAGDGALDADGAPVQRVLRTHTSAGQIRAMRALGAGGTAPVRVILPGVCYRNEDITTRSEVQFTQIEGLMVGRDVRLSDLKGILLQFARLIFGGEQAVRMRGSYFPFTEPSVEVDLRCALCGGAGCRVCKYSGWLELLGAGLVHPTVLRNGGYDPETHRGVAFGVGLPRLVMLRHGVDDIRHFYRNDLRFLQTFR